MRQHHFLILVVIFGLVVFGGLGFMGYRAYVEKNEEKWAAEKQKKDEARKQVEAFAEQLHGDREKYKYKRFTGELPVDPWGNPLVVRYAGKGIVFRGETLKVISAGPDGRIDTPDDIVSERSSR